MLMIRNERGDYKNMATANGVYNTTSTMHNENYTIQLTQNFENAQFPHCCIYPYAESSNTQYMPNSQKISDGTVKITWPLRPELFWEPTEQLQFNSHLLNCQLNSTMASYMADGWQSAK